MSNNIWIGGSFVFVIIFSGIFYYLRRNRYTQNWLGGSEEEVKSGYEKLFFSLMIVSIVALILSVVIKFV